MAYKKVGEEVTGTWPKYWRKYEPARSFLLFINLVTSLKIAGFSIGGTNGI
jgi:hypothetical protein